MTINSYQYTEDSYEQTVFNLFRELDYEVLLINGPEYTAISFKFKKST